MSRFLVFIATAALGVTAVASFEGQLPGAFISALAVSEPVRGDAFWQLENDGGGEARVDADIDADLAGRIADGSGVRVAVIDGAFNREHSSLRGHYTNGWDFIDHDFDPFLAPGDEREFHAGAVAGSVLQVAGNAEIVPVRALSGGSGSQATLAAAIQWASARADVIVLALGIERGASDDFSALEQAVDRAGAAGVAIVAAAGNAGADNDSSSDNVFLPAAFAERNVIAVAATDAADRVWMKSNVGARSVDLAAPGVGVWAPGRGEDGLISGDGTSLAAPLVAGVIAAMLELRPHLSAVSIRRFLIDSSDPIRGSRSEMTAGGRLNAAAALREVAPKRSHKRLLRSALER